MRKQLGQIQAAGRAACRGQKKRATNQEETHMWWRLLMIVTIGFVVSTGCRSKPDTGGGVALRENGSLEPAGRDRGVQGRAIESIDKDR